MDKERLKVIIQKFNAGELDESGIRELEQLIEDGSIDLNDLSSVYHLYDQMDKIPIPVPGKDMDASFYTMLNQEKSKTADNFLNRILEWLKYSGSFTPSFKLAYASILVIIGIGIGILLTINRSNNQINLLTSEIKQMQNMMMLTLLDKPSTTERLKAIHLTNEIYEADEQVIDALLKTLNNDENANIRLAAIDALIKYADNDLVRMGMVESITRQDLPIVQVALADAMVVIQEKRAVSNLKKILDMEETDQAVKKKIDESIKKLI